ncbi:MAG: DUF4352 domain-containing protein [Actinomycetota bacterium]|nr:DUF4352 domain-containing protein [Actinomycetota bacterium]
MRQKKLAAVFLVILAAFVGGCGGEEEAASSADEADEQGTVTEQTTEPAEETTEDTEASVGEPVTVGDVQWTVTDVRQTEILVSDLGNEEGNFVYTDVTFVNNSNQDITLATPFVTLLDDQGREYEADVERNFRHIEPERNMFAGPVGPGETKYGRVIYSVEPDASSFRLQVREGRFASDEVAYIDLGVPEIATSS